jgi:transcriptional regulator with XRE-family HTH domain
MNAPERIGLARKEAKLSLRAAGSAAGISDKWWRDVVEGAPADDDTLAKMALAVGLTPADVTGDPEYPGLPDLVAKLTPAYEASVEMRARIGLLAREAMAELKLDTQGLAEAAGVRPPVASGFRKGQPWPTAPELAKLCRVLHWDAQAVEDLIWSGTKPATITGTSLVTNQAWRAGIEARISDLEQTLAEFLSLSRGPDSAPEGAREP